MSSRSVLLLSLAILVGVVRSLLLRFLVIVAISVASLIRFESFLSISRKSVRFSVVTSVIYGFSILSAIRIRFLSRESIAFHFIVISEFLWVVEVSSLIKGLSWSLASSLHSLWVKVRFGLEVRVMIISWLPFLPLIVIVRSWAWFTYIHIKTQLIIYHWWSVRH